MVDDAVPRQALIVMAKSDERDREMAAKGLRVATPTNLPKLSDLGINKTQSKSRSVLFLGERMPDIRPSEPHRRTPSPDVSAAAFHESGHAVAIVLAFRNAAWLPKPPPPLPVRYVEITDYAAGWSGNCFATDIYSMKWPIDCIAPRFGPLMEAQVVVELSGGVAEAVFRGERRRQEVLAFAESNCCIDADSGAGRSRAE